jgi:hypothetical protein
MADHISFNELKEQYNQKKRGCKKWLGKSYIPGKIEHRHLQQLNYKEKNIKFMEINGKKMYDVHFYEIENQGLKHYPVYKNERIIYRSCKNFICVDCRKKLKKELHENILREIYRLNMDTHMIFTFPGLSLRLKNDYKKSYKMVNNDFNKLIKRLNYYYDRIINNKKIRLKNNLFHNNEIPLDELAYICLPRAQAKPEGNNPAGFCHLHVIMNWTLNVHAIEEIIKKNNYKLGYVFVRKNQSVADYLCKDYFDDDEWVIPKLVKHYHTSKNVIINIGKGIKIDNDVKIYKKQSIKEIEKDLNNNVNNYQVFGKTLIVKNPLILPFEEYVKQFYDLTNKEVYSYGDLKKFTKYNKKHNDFYNKEVK